MKKLSLARVRTVALAAIARMAERPVVTGKYPFWAG
jgi:hypothetical protein